MSAPPERPCDDIGGLNAFSRETLSCAADFLDRPFRARHGEDTCYGCDEQGWPPSIAHVSWIWQGIIHGIVGMLVVVHLHKYQECTFPKSILMNDKLE
jgi:hypothetical protein